MSNAKEALVASWLDLSWNQGRFNLIKDFLSPDFYYQTTFAEDILTLDQYIGFIKTFRKAIPDLSIHVEEVMSKGDRVMTSISFSGTVQKPIFGIPASDKIITFPAVSLWSVSDGRIASLNTLIDISGLERQLKAELKSDKPLEERHSEG